MKAIHNMMAVDITVYHRCCDDVKDRKNESHSQLHRTEVHPDLGVVTMSKIGKMKAIHNPEGTRRPVGRGVVTMSKIGKMKAIHNNKTKLVDAVQGVVTMSKIGKMKAIHNTNIE